MTKDVNVKLKNKTKPWLENEIAFEKRASTGRRWNTVCECVRSFLRSSLTNCHFWLILIEGLFVFVCLEYIPFVPPRGDGEAAALTVIRYSTFNIRGLHRRPEAFSQSYFMEDFF